MFIPCLLPRNWPEVAGEQGLSSFCQVASEGSLAGFCCLKGLLEFYARQKECVDYGSSYEVSKITLKGLSSCKEEQLGPLEMP